MAKTVLNESVDNFFKTHNLNDINESTIKSNLNINATNDYGNILHAIINYKYEESAVLKTIEILLDLGVNPNYRGKSTGMTFIHLAFYGYTDKNNVDQPYSEDFIVKLITLAKSHGFDVNIKDNDDETPAIAAIASEVYRGSVSNIIESLGREVILDDEFKEAFEEYLSESITNPNWNKRLLNEKASIYKLIEDANTIIEEIENPDISPEDTKDTNINPEDTKDADRIPEDAEEAAMPLETTESTNNKFNEIENKISSHITDLTSMTTDLNYETLKNTYKDISSIIKNLLSVLKKEEVSEVTDNDTNTKINNTISSISNCLTNEINDMKTNPNSSRIEAIKPILQEFLLSELIAIVNGIENDYHDYQDNLRTSAKKIRTIQEGKNFLEEIKGTEIESELSEIVEAIMDSINKVITSLKKCIEEDKKSFDLISSFTDEEYEEENPDYTNLTKEELEEIIQKTNGRTSSYREYIFNYLTKTFDALSSSVAPIIENAIITEEDIKNCLIKSLTKNNQGEKNNYGRYQN